MTRIGQERSAVGEHTDERVEMPGSRQVVEMFIHPDFIVEEPPCGTVLNLPSGFVGLKTTDKRHYFGVHFGVKVKNYSPRQGVFVV